MLLTLLLYSSTWLWNVASAGNIPPGWPGIPHRWAPAHKQALGTAYEAKGRHESPIWFTVTEGALSEIFYPRADQPQIGNLEFIVTDGSHFFSEQKTGSTSSTLSEVTFTEGMAVQIKGEDPLHSYSFIQRIVTDSHSPTLRIHTHFNWKTPGLRLFIQIKPTLGLGLVQKDGLFATSNSTLGRSSPPIHMALLSSAKWLARTAGYTGISDGLQKLFTHFYLAEPLWNTAGPGSISLTGEVEVGSHSGMNLDLALSFGSSSQQAEQAARVSLIIPFDEILSQYETGWKTYLNLLRRESDELLFPLSLIQKSAVVIKMHEDKQNRGAIVAALSTPSNPGRTTEDAGGYHLVWPYDLYTTALGLLAVGDRETPVSIFRYFLKTQLKSGTWSPHVWVDGTPFQIETEKESDTPLDIAALPILLAHQLQRHLTYRLQPEEVEMIRKATSYLLTHGPKTPSDRWGQKGGYVSSSLAILIASLRCASHLLQDPTPEKASRPWQASLETWTQGKYYYAGDTLENGFLQLVRLGIRNPEDPRIIAALHSQALLWPSTYPLYPRYFKEKYEEQKESLWPVLTAERGYYEIAARNFERARQALQTIEKNSTSTGLIPEQLHAPLRVRLGVACPLVWGHAEYILLHRSLQEGTLFDAPKCR